MKPESITNYIDVGRDASIMRIRLSRSSKKNALTDGMQRQIADALCDADADPAVAVVVIEADGNDFCAGNDFAMIADMASGAISVDDLAVDHFLGALSGFGKPLIAAVRGRAIGVGATMLLHCDVVIATHDCRITFPFVDLSLVPEAASTYLLPASVGYARAYALLCMTEAIRGIDAVAAGLITRSVADHDLTAEVDAVAASLARKPGRALRATKTLMKRNDAIRAALSRDRAMFIEQLDTIALPKVCSSSQDAAATHRISGDQK